MFLVYRLEVYGLKIYRKIQVLIYRLAIHKVAKYRPRNTGSETQARKIATQARPWIATCLGMVKASDFHNSGKVTNCNTSKWYIGSF